MPLLSLPLSCITERLLLRTVRDSSILVRGPTLVKKSVRLGMICGRMYGRRYGPVEPKVTFKTNAYSCSDDIHTCESWLGQPYERHNRASAPERAPCYDMHSACGVPSQCNAYSTLLCPIKLSHGVKDLLTYQNEIDRVLHRAHGITIARCRRHSIETRA